MRLLEGSAAKMNTETQNSIYLYESIPYEHPKHESLTATAMTYNGYRIFKRGDTI